MPYYKTSNLDIKMMYISNEDNMGDEWKNELFNSLMFFADARINRANIFYDKEDFKQEAYIGLWEAICTFDHHKNFDFYRWAQWNISSRVRNLLSCKSRNNSVNYDTDCEDDFYEIDDDAIFIKMSLNGHYKFLSTRERKVLRDIFFLGKTLLEVGTDLGISLERVRQIKQEATNKLGRV